MYRQEKALLFSELEAIITSTILKTTELRVGLLMNFNATLFKDGLRRIVL
jgi:hypothetical protein